jgi:hypothetical protein
VNLALHAPQRRQHPLHERGEGRQQRHHEPDEPAHELLPEAPQLPFIRGQTHRDAEGEGALALGVILELDGAALDRHAIVPEGGIDRAALAVCEQRAEIRAGIGRGRRLPLVQLRADLRVQARARRGEARIKGILRRCIAAARLRFGRGDEGNHLRVQQLLHRALR